MHKKCTHSKKGVIFAPTETEGMTKKNYHDRVDALFQREYGTTAEDLGVTVAETAGAMAEGQTPEEYVEGYAEKYDLTPTREADPLGLFNTES